MKLNSYRNTLHFSVHNQRQAGFTLIETLIALLLLSFSIGAALEVIFLNRQKIVRAEEYIEVLRLVDQIKSDHLRAKIPDNRISGTTDNRLAWSLTPTKELPEMRARIWSIHISKDIEGSRIYRFVHLETPDKKDF